MSLERWLDGAPSRRSTPVKARPATELSDKVADPFDLDLIDEKPQMASIKSVKSEPTSIFASASTSTTVGAAPARQSFIAAAKETSSHARSASKAATAAVTPSVKRETKLEDSAPVTAQSKRTSSAKRASKAKPTESISSIGAVTSRKRKASALSSGPIDPAAGLARVDAWRERYNAHAESAGARVTLSSLTLQHVKAEVLTMDEVTVQSQLEKLVVSITRSILSDTGFSFDVPVRSAGNQLFVPEINRIVLKDKTSKRDFLAFKHTRKAAITMRVLQLVYELCQKRIHVTKRDLFYTDVKLFKQQLETDDVLDDVASMLSCTRSSLNVVASEKGIVVGQLSFREAGDLIDCTRMGVGGKAIPPYIDRITDMQGSARFVLLVEKDAAFMRLAEDRFYNQYPCVIITAKGQPDVATRLFLKKVKETLQIPILGLVDSDPYGLKILSVYLSGSKNMSYDSASLTTPDIQWLGVRPSDLDRYNIPEQCRLPMTDTDIATGRQLLNEEFIQKNPQWHSELQRMIDQREKAEIQALSNFGFQFLTQVYLPQKLRDGDWI